MATRNSGEMERRRLRVRRRRPRPASADASKFRSRKFVTPPKFQPTGKARAGETPQDFQDLAARIERLRDRLRREEPECSRSCRAPRNSIGGRPVDFP